MLRRRAGWVSQNFADSKNIFEKNAMKADFFLVDK